MMRRYLFIVTVSVLCTLVSCVITEAPGVDTVKPPVVLQLTVTNNTDAAISVQIRHRYNKAGWPGGDISYSDWIGSSIPAGESAILGGETAVYMDEGVEKHMSGFVLLDDERNRYFGESDGSYSSFELTVTARDKAIQLAGYESEAPYFAETRLCDLLLMAGGFGPVSRALFLFHKATGNTYRLDSPRLLAASLRINADGTYAFALEPPEELPEYRAMQR